MYYYVKTVPLNILGENQDTALKDYDSDLYYEFVNKVVGGEVLRARPNNKDILYFLFKEQDVHWIDLLKVDTVEKATEIPALFIE